MTEWKGRERAEAMASRARAPEVAMGSLVTCGVLDVASRCESAAASLRRNSLTGPIASEEGTTSIHVFGEA